MSHKALSYWWSRVDDPVIIYPPTVGSLSFLTAISRWTRVTQYQNVSILDFIGAKSDGIGGDV